MNQLGIECRTAFRPQRLRLLAALGLATIAITLGQAKVATAEAGSGDQRGHRRGDNSAHGDRPGAGNDQHRRGGGGAGNRDHEQGHAGGTGVEHRDHAARGQEMEQRLADLQAKNAQGTLTASEQQELARLQQFSSRRQTDAQRKARLAELKQKETAGTLAPNEKTELDKVQQIQARHEALDLSTGQKAQTRPKRSRDSKRQALQEYPNLGDSAVAAAEYEKHANRLAQLERAKELALADQRTDVSQKVDTLMAQENQRHQNWLTQHPPTPQGNTQAASQGAAQ